MCPSTQSASLMESLERCNNNQKKTVRGQTKLRWITNPREVPALGQQDRHALTVAMGRKLLARYHTFSFDGRSMFQYGPYSNMYTEGVGSRTEAGSHNIPPLPPQETAMLVHVQCSAPIAYNRRRKYVLLST